MFCKGGGGEGRITLEMNTGACMEGVTHVVATVRSVPGLVNFIIDCELPIPLRKLFPSHEKWILNLLDYCPAPLNLINPQRKFVCGQERWAVHCHCFKPFSLQCLAGGALVSKVLKNYIYGARFNAKFLMYREICNYNCSDSLAYIGSIMYKKTHFIYLKVRHDDMYLLLRKNVRFGNHVGVCSIFGNYIIITCKKCHNINYNNVQSCAYRTRKKIVQCYKTLYVAKKWKLVSAQSQESYRQSCLKKFCKYKIPINIKHPKWFPF